MIRYGQIEKTPVGPIWVAISEHGIVALDFYEDEEGMRKFLSGSTKQEFIRDQDVVTEIAHQLEEYFAGRQLDFNLAIDWGSFGDFQSKVLQHVARIPPGQVKTYGQIAEELGLNKTAARAVGRANATNPIPIIIPCHRVIGANGNLTGYGGPGGIKMKAWLLEIEGYDAIHQLPLQL